jgi:hypothetical protein
VRGMTRGRSGLRLNGRHMGLPLLNNYEPCHSDGRAKQTKSGFPIGSGMTLYDLGGRRIEIADDSSHKVL